MTCIQGRDPGEMSNLPNGQNPHLKYCLQVKTKEDAVGRDLGLQTGKRQYTWRWKSRCLVNKCFLGHVESMGPRVVSGFYALPLTPPHLAHILCKYLW